MATTKTQLDIYDSATKAARGSMTATSSFDIEFGAITTFKKEGQDPKDWDLWKRNFDQHLRNCLAMSKTAAPSAGGPAPGVAGARPGSPVTHQPPVGARAVTPAASAAVGAGTGIPVTPVAPPVIAPPK